MIRYGIISSTHSRELIESYLPANYHVVHEDDNGQGTLIAGEDDHGWTLDDYVIPRMGSGLIVCREVHAVFVADQQGLMSYTGPGYCMDVPRAWILRQVSPNAT